MKVVVGIDTDRIYQSAVALLAALQLDLDRLTLLHACSPVLTYAPFGMPAGVIEADLLDSAIRAGEHALGEACAQADGLGLRADTATATDTPAHALIKAGEEADLIAVGAHQRDAVRALFMGSVSRALAIGSRTSLLVAKGAVPQGRPLRAVFATDHSPYAEKCLDHLLELAPRGLERIDVLTAYEINDYEATLLHVQMQKLGGMVDEFLEEELGRRGEEAAARIRAKGYASDVIIAQGKPNDVIHREVTSRNTDLLIIGAQGHGLMANLMIGSVSLHQVVGEPYPVLLLRA